MMEWHFLLTNIYTSLNSFKKSCSWCKCEREIDGWRETNTDCYNDFFLAALWDAAPLGHPAIHWCSLRQTKSLLATNWDWPYLMCASVYVISQHPHNFHSTRWLLLVIYTGCVQCREISDWWLGEGSICYTKTISHIMNDSMFLI